MLFDEVCTYVQKRLQEFDLIDSGRQRVLRELADYVGSTMASGGTARLVFICTHNSRRSHLSEIWAAVAAAHYRLAAVETYSGGTEATAFNPRAVAALERSGCAVSVAGAADNPEYSIRFGDSVDVPPRFSKIYSASPNPTQGFCAVMTCDSAEKACPTVSGATKRLAISYVDPQVADDTADEATVYDERCAQIAREMLFALAIVADPG